MLLRGMCFIVSSFRDLRGVRGGRCEGVVRDEKCGWMIVDEC